MHDTIIRGGRIIDGTGRTGYIGDVAIDNGTISAIGRQLGEAKATIDANGAIVTPGFIDIHTHYDGQFIWDDILEPSFSNGTTTVIAGNCGVGFAPVDAVNRARLIEMMEGVEDIPGIVLDEGLDWAWRSFPDYLNRLAQKEFTMDVASYLPHAPLRVFVMGERALAHEPATDADLVEMKRIVREAMEAGAIGVSGSRILEHKSSTGAHVPGTFAEDREFIALAEAMGETGKGVFQMVPFGTAGGNVGTAATTQQRLDEHARFERISAACGRPVTYLLHSHDHAPEEWRLMLAASEQANKRGLAVYPQVAARGLGLVMALDSYHIFQARPSYMDVAHLPRVERVRAMRDPARRGAILSERNVLPVGTQGDRILGLVESYTKILHRFYKMTPPVDYEPSEDRRLDKLAEATGLAMEDVVYDTLADGDGNNMFVDFVMNYTNGNLDSVHDMLENPTTLSGLGDGGAHLLSICDAAMTTYHLSFWSRDRKRGPTLQLEAMVAKLTGKPAEVFGLNDRGVIAIGRRADINVINLEQLGSAMPEITFDLPKGSGRLLQGSSGYLATIVNGVITRRNDRDTGQRPGRLLRASSKPHVSL